MNDTTFNCSETQNSLQFYRIDSLLFLSMFSQAYYTVAFDNEHLEFILN